MPGNPLRPEPFIAVRLAAAAAFLSLLVFLLMTLHWASRPVLGGVIVLAGLTALPMVRTIRRPHLPWWAIAVTLPFAVYGIVNALAPETEADPNTYHLQPALDALQHHGFSGEISFYERLPQAAEMLYVPAFAFGGAPAAKLLHFGFLLATLPLIVGIGRRLALPDTASCAAAVLYFITPVVQVSAASAFNDAALVFAGTAVVYVLLAEGPPWLAGILAGFCYGIKMTGGIVILAGLLWLIARRQYRSALVFSAAASILVLPWVGRNLVQTGNPFAPFFNRWFPNPYFHLSTEQQLGINLRSYGVSFFGRFPELLWGWRLHGIIGPVFALAPLGLLALRRRKTAILPLVALVFSIPWWLNAGTRFLVPVIPFTALALSGVLPGAALVPVLAVHAATSWPDVIPLYSPRTWRLYQFPWRAALHLESPEHFLERTSWDYRVAKFIGDHTTPQDVILDFHGVHSAHIRRQFVGYWQSARGENAFRALEFAREPGREQLYAVRAALTQPVTAIRIRQTAAAGTEWSIVEVECFHEGRRVPGTSQWSVQTNPNPWEAPYAFDGNLASRWKTWQRAEPGQFLSVDFGAATNIDSIRVIGTRRDGGTRMEIDAQPPRATWITLNSTELAVGQLNLRREATRFLKKLGITHIAGRAGYDDTGQLAFTLANDAPEWGLEVVGNLDTVYLLKIP